MKKKIIKSFVSNKLFLGALLMLLLQTGIAIFLPKLVQMFLDAILEDSVDFRILGIYLFLSCVLYAAELLKKYFSSKCAWETVGTLREKLVQRILKYRDSFGIYLFLSCVLYAAELLKKYFSSKCAWETVGTLREKLVQRILKYRDSFFKNTDTGEWLLVFNDDIKTIESFLENSMKAGSAYFKIPGFFFQKYGYRGMAAGF